MQVLFLKAVTPYFLFVNEFFSLKYSSTKDFWGKNNLSWLFLDLFLIISIILFLLRNFVLHIKK